MSVNMASRILENRMLHAAKRLDECDEPFFLAKLIADHYARLAHLALTLSKVADQQQYTFPIPESTAQVVAHLCNQITEDFRLTFGYNPPWLYKHLGKDSIVIAPNATELKPACALQIVDEQQPKQS